MSRKFSQPYTHEEWECHGYPNRERRRAFKFYTPCEECQQEHPRPRKAWTSSTRAFLKRHKSSRSHP